MTTAKCPRCGKPVPAPPPPLPPSLCEPCLDFARKAIAIEMARGCKDPKRHKELRAGVRYIHAMDMVRDAGREE